MKVMTIIGARPQFIKESALSKQLRKNHGVIVVHTGQHYDHNMSGAFFEELNIPKPDYNLGINSGDQSEQVGRTIIELGKLIEKVKPDAIIVYGDTNSTLAGAIAANKKKIKLVHIEAGLRSFDKSMPEEINRIITDHCSEILFCPTNLAVQNLKEEGISKNVFQVGDVMYDSILNFQKIAESNILERLRIKSKKYYLATVHRQSNTDIKENLLEIFEGFRESGEKIIFPLHPRTAKYLKEYGINHKNSNILMIEPVSYLEMISLVKNARKILTDSGGLQKEAFFLGVPCITLRESTEWRETVENGWNILVGTNKGKIKEAIKNFSPNLERKSHYGDGRASEKICDLLEKHVFIK